jgi:hypothetical protein
MKHSPYSSVSAKAALAALQEAGYTTETRSGAPRPTEKAAALKHPGAELSRTGKSLRLVFAGEALDGRDRELFIPVKGMLTKGAVNALETAAHIKFEV